MIRLFAIGLLPLAFAASAADPLAEARAAYARGDFTNTISHATNSIAKNPWQEDSRVLHIRALMAQGRFAEARTVTTNAMAKLASKGCVKQQLRTWSSTSPLVQGTLLQRDGARAGLITSVLPNRDSPGCIGLALVRRQHLDATSLRGPTGEELILQRPSGFQDPPQPVAS